MVYQSKKDPNVTASFDFADEKCATTRLIYLTGEKAGKSFVVSNSTLKRWWKVVEKKEDNNSLNIDMEQVNTPYNPDVTPHYIPKPKSVIEYEAQKNKKYNADLPSFEEIVNIFGSNLKKVNEASKYVMFNDKTTMWRKSVFISIYSTEKTWEALTKVGLTSFPNKDKERPFGFKLNNKEEFDKAERVLNA